MEDRNESAPAGSKGLTRREIVVGAGGLAAGVLVGGGGGIALGRGPLDSSGSGGGATKAASGPPVLVGSSIPLTGFASGDGQDMVRGFEIAMDEINANGGIAGRPLKLVSLDAATFAPDVMVNNFKRLITEKKVDVILGGYQVNTGPEYDIVANAGMLYYHNNTIEANAKAVRDNPSKYWMVFQNDPTEIWYSRSLPGVLESLEASGTWKPPNHEIVIVNANNSYSAGLTAELRRVIKGTKWSITLVESAVAPNTQWGPTLEKIRSRPPALIWVTDYFAGDDASFIKQFVQAPTQSLVHMQYGPSVPEFLQLAKSAGNGVSWASTIAIAQDSLGKAFTAKYEKRYNEQPGFSQGGATYDATWLYATAASLAGGPDDKRKIAAISRELIFRGVCGSRRYDPDDQTCRPYPTYTQDSSLGMPTLYFQIQDGKHVPFFPDPYAAGGFQLPPWFKA